MAVGYARFVRSHLDDEERSELEAVDELADLLRRHLEASTIAIDAAHVHKAGSSDIQRIASRLLKVELGFLEETRFAEDTGFTTRARPDFIYRLSDGRGVLAEVERGGTTTNNHDLKDFCDREDHEEMLGWAGESFDPEAFNPTDFDGNRKTFRLMHG